LLGVVNGARVRLLADNFRRRHAVDIHSRGRLVVPRHAGRDDHRAQHNQRDEGEKSPLVAIEQPQIVRKRKRRRLCICCLGLSLINDCALDERLRAGGGIRRRKGKDSFLIKHYDSRGLKGDERRELCKAHAPRVPPQPRHSSKMYYMVCAIRPNCQDIKTLLLRMNNICKQHKIKTFYGQIHCGRRTRDCSDTLRSPLRSVVYSRNPRNFKLPSDNCPPAPSRIPGLIPCVDSPVSVSAPARVKNRNIRTGSRSG